MADDGPSFDRPGIGFATEVLAPGGIAWEQGLPDYTRDRQDGVRSEQYVADSLLRVGLGANLELQLGSDSYAWLHEGGAHTHGGGDSHVALKLQLPSQQDSFSWAVLGTYTVPTGKPALSDGGHARELGVTGAWDLAQGRSVSLYADYEDDDQGHTWTFSPSYTFYDDTRFSSYVEAGLSTGTEHDRVAGAGGIWKLSDAVQLDLSFLRGLTAASPDWQAGFGVAFAFR
ncbi:transporter [Xanthomonas sp. Kuri4-3]